MPCLCREPQILALQIPLRGSLNVDVYNKIDAISLEQMDKLAREDHTVVISCELGLKCVIELVPWCITEADVALPNIAWTTSSREFGKNLA